MVSASPRSPPRLAAPTPSVVATKAALRDRRPLRLWQPRCNNSRSYTRFGARCWFPTACSLSSRAKLALLLLASFASDGGAADLEAPFEADVEHFVSGVQQVDVQKAVGLPNGLFVHRVELLLRDEGP